MEKIGSAKFDYKKCRSTYSFQWHFGKNVWKLKEFAELTNRNRIETEAISFESGILGTTKHSLKIFHFAKTGETVMTIEIENPNVKVPYTHSKMVLKPFTIAPIPNPNNYKGTFTHPPEEFLGNNFEQNELKENMYNENGCENLIYNCLECDHEYSGLMFTFNFEHTYWRDEDVVTTISENKLEAGEGKLSSFTTMDTTSWFESKQLTDFAIFCGDSVFNVHKIVLASRSPVFASMFRQPLNENLEGKMSIKDFYPQSMEEFLKFLYTGSGNLESHASELFLLANKYCVDNLKQLCENHLLKTVSIENAQDMYALGQLANSDKLSNRSLETLKRNKKELMKTVEDIVSFCQEFPLAYQVVFDE